jgi:dTDP-4-amino-4,6-dideoxygalactose transaminase
MFPGHNMRMEGIQGAILTVKLKYLHQWNDLRRQAARYYAQVLHESQLILPQEMPRCKHVYHLYVVCVDDRDGLRDQLGKLGVESGLHYPTPLHLQPAYSHLDYQRGDFPVTEFVASRVLSLPMYPGISTEAIDHVAAAMLEICNVA